MVITLEATEPKKSANTLVAEARKFANKLGRGLYTDEAKRYISTLSNELDQQIALNKVQAENITACHEQMKIQRDAIEAALRFAHESQSCPHNCGANCCQSGRLRILAAEVLELLLQKSLTPKGEQSK